MASPPPPSPFISQNSIVLTQSEIMAFHNVDRTLYSRLAIDLRRDPMESIQVMAFWIWLERLGGHGGSLIVRMNGLTEGFLIALADEAVTCLVCLQNKVFHNTRSLAFTELVTGHDLLLSLRTFHSNHARITDAITRIMDEVCLKAFPDIIRRAIQIQACPNPNPNPNPNLNPNPNNNNIFYQNKNPSNKNGLVFVPNPSNQFDVPIMDPTLAFLHKTRANNPGQATPGSSNYNALFVKEGGYLDLLFRPLSDNSRDDLEMEEHHEFLNNELADVLEHIQLQGPISAEGSEENEEEVPPDERTIFLTFSKGYPISEQEVADFFTRKYGDIYEAIHMQEKADPTEQPLYARLVLRSVSTIPVVLGKKVKAKFSINGKHVWARKYVRRSGPKSPTAPGGHGSGSSPDPLPLFLSHRNM